MMYSTIREKVELPLPIDNVIPIQFRRKINVYVLFCKEFIVKSSVPSPEYYAIDVDIDKDHLHLLLDHQIGPVYLLAINMALKKVGTTYMNRITHHEKSNHGKR